MYIQGKAMLANLSVSMWSGRKYDPKVSKEIEINHNAGNSGRYNKILVSPSYLLELQRLVGSARTYHYNHTLPWFDDGTRVLPSALFFDYAQKMSILKAEYEAGVEAFIRNYPAYIEEAKVRLADMFDANDYPSADTLKGRYELKTIISPIPDSGDFRVNLGLAERTAMRQEYSKQVNIAVTNAIQHLWRRLKFPIERMKERLSDKEAIFRDSLVDNVLDACDAVLSLNIADDPNITAIANDAKLLLNVEPQQLRNDDTLRDQQAAAATSILQRISGYLQE